MNANDLRNIPPGPHPATRPVTGDSPEAKRRRVRDEIASLIDWLGLELDKDDGEPITWASVGSLGHVREELVNVLAFLSDTEAGDIRRNLDELHS